MKFKQNRALALVLAVAMLFSLLAVSASATTLEEAKNSVATVNVQWRYSNSRQSDGAWLGRDAGETLPSDETINTSVYAEHDYATDGKNVFVDYRANLSMTDVMAEYLCPRQTQLMRAEFVVTVNLDAAWLTFDTQSDTVKVNFDSTFLKPNENPSDAAWDGASDITMPTGFELVKKVGDRYYYEISYRRADLEGASTIRVPMELILTELDGEPVGYNDIGAIPGSVVPMYSDYTVADWMAPIYVEIADMTVRSNMDVNVTTDPASWHWLVANGTVEGEFEYCTDDIVASVSDFAGQNTRTLAFGEGDDKEIPAWYSYDARVLLKRTGGTSTRPEQDKDVESPYLNLVDHFAYIIGYPDGLVHPEGNITRAEVATIFFRMLTDEVRTQYWSTTNPYSDVASSAWYNNAISTLSNLKIIEGYPDGTFHPQGNITRAEFATMAIRFFETTGKLADAQNQIFTDTTGHWAYTNINLAYLLGIVDGYPDGTFRPQNDITRAEAMTIVNNTLRRAPCVEGMLPDAQMITWPDNMDKAIWYYPEVQEATNSHDYERFANGDEDWTAPLPVRDWAAFEKEWSTANAAANPGEVVDESTVPVAKP